MITGKTKDPRCTRRRSLKVSIYGSWHENTELPDATNLSSLQKRRPTRGCGMLRNYSWYLKERCTALCECTGPKRFWNGVNHQKRPWKSPYILMTSIALTVVIPTGLSVRFHELADMKLPWKVSSCFLSCSRLHVVNLRYTRSRMERKSHIWEDPVHEF